MSERSTDRSERVLVTREECIAQAKLGQEIVTCTSDHKPDEPHQNPCYGVWPPCPNCGGLEEHTTKCPTPERVGLTTTWAVVTWRTGHKPKVACGKRWRAR